MKRTQMLLAAVVVVLLLALFYVLLLQPARDELATVEEQIAAEQVAQQDLITEVARLESVRATAPEAEAQVAAATAAVPRDASLPSALRQVQLAADESGISLLTVTTGRPVATASELPNLFQIDVSLELTGSYFQVVDFLRRTEDPLITPRGLAWSAIEVSADEGTYPELAVRASGRVFAVMDALVTAEAPVPDDGGAETPESEDVEPPVDGDTEPADVEVEG